MDRRNFLKTSLAASTATLAAASLLESCTQSTKVAPSYQGKRLVLISLDGGHDGLHAMAPKDNEMMMKLRPKIYADTKRQGIPLSLTGNTEFVLHRNLKSLMPSLETGDLRIIPNAGLPLNEWNGSHFVSQDFWSAAEYDGNRNPVGINGTGWIGRLLERPKMHIGQFQRTAIAIEPLTPLVLKGKNLSGVAWPGLEASETIKSQLDAWLDEITPIENNSVYTEMADLSMIYQWLNQTQPMSGFPSSGIGQQLAHAASLILGDHPFKVIKCSEGGFDTHNGQLESHQNSYPKLSASISAFYEFLKTNRLLEQTLVVIYSEFGRTIYENSAMGTEHGTAGPIFVIGGQKNTLQEFTNVSFKFETETLQGTSNTEYLKHQVDFRNVFKNIQESWLDCI
jgi:uncharacterized protein (DUF1501 family)